MGWKLGTTETKLLHMIFMMQKNAIRLINKIKYRDHTINFPKAMKNLTLDYLSKFKFALIFIKLFLTMMTN